MSVAHRKIEIPLGTGEEFIELEVNDLPDPQETIGILQDQNCRINLWIQIAIEYYRQANEDAFELLINTCLSRWNELKDHPDADKDRIRALDLLAIFYVRKGFASKNREPRRGFFARAAQKFTEVDKSDFITISKHGPEYRFHLLGRAYCCLIEGRNDQADTQFKFVLQQQQHSGEPENVPSLLGRACIEFNKKDVSGIRNALALYKKALQICPNVPADVRVGLAICFYKLDMIDKAEDAFLRALSLDSRCVGALTGLAVIELNKKTTPSIKRGMDYLSKAYRIEGNDPMVLTLLADHFFYANEHDKVIKLATRAMENTENEAMQAQACYQLARAYHKKGGYDEAFEYYYKATQFGGSQFILAFYGLGQMYIHKREYKEAIQAFETVHKTNPGDHDTMKILASLYSRSDSQTKKEQARVFLKKVTEDKPEDLEAWVELASLTEQHDTPAALAAYKTAIRLYGEKSEQVPPELYNNLAALLFSLNELDESERYYQLAIGRCEEEMPNNELHYGSIIYTIKYNMGRLFEAKHQSIEAEKIYKEILVQHPMYLDCYLRLGCMERDKGLLFDASDKFKETFRIKQDNFEAWTLIGNLHLSKLELTPGQRKFERILEISKLNPDCYSLLSIGNVWLQSQYQNIKDQEKLNIQRLRALQFFKAALKHDPKNIYAASGIGCIFAVRGMFNEARDVFSQVREATADFPDVWINIAHIYVEQRQYVAAVQMYENCLKKFYNDSNTDIMSYIARALFKANKLADCKRILLRARHIAPYDLTILYNLAKVLKTLAKQIFEDRKSTYHAVVTAEYELKLAQSYFRYYTEYREKYKDYRSSIDPKLVEKEERDCADLLLQVEKSIKLDAEQRDKEESQRRIKHQEQLAKELARKAEEEELRLKEERVKKEELESRRRELLKRQEEAKQKMLNEDSGVVPHDDGSDDGEPRSSKKKKRTKQKADDGFVVDDDESDQEGDARPPKKKKRTKKVEQEKPEKPEKYKSRAILSSDSSSSDD